MAMARANAPISKIPGKVSKQQEHVNNLLEW